MNPLRIALAIIAVIATIDVFSVMGQVMGYVIGIGTIVFLVALAVHPERTRDYSVKVIEAAADICRALGSKLH